MKIILTQKFTTSKNVISKVLNLFTEHVVIYVYTYTGNLFSLPQRIEFVSNIEMFIQCQVEHWRQRWRDYEELYSFSILQNFIRSSLSSNWFQSVNFAGNPHFAAEEVRQGVDGGRRTVGSWESAKVQVTSPVVLVDTRLHESMRAYVSPRPWTRTRKDGWRSCDEEESHRVDKVGGKRGIGEKKKSGKVKSGVKKREGERENERRRRRGPVKSYPKRVEQRRARGSAQLQLPFRSPRLCVREDRSTVRIVSLVEKATSSSLLSLVLFWYACACLRCAITRPLILWRAPTLINAKLRHRTFPRFEAPRLFQRGFSISTVTTTLPPPTMSCRYIFSLRRGQCSFNESLLSLNAIVTFKLAILISSFVMNHLATGYTGSKNVSGKLSSCKLSSCITESGND